MFRLANALAVSAAALLFVGCASSDVINPGRLHGKLTFSNGGAGAVAARLAAAPPAADPGASITLHAPPSTAVAASTSYTPASAPDAATYDINPNADPPGPVYLIEGTVAFADSATYRFGSRRQNSPYAQVCDPVAPLTESPEGTVCDVSECGAVPMVRLELTGADADIDALDPDENVVCTLTATIDEVPGAGLLGLQATRSVVASVGDLRAGDVVVPFLVRGGANATLKAVCAAHAGEIPAGDPQFVLDPDTGLVPLLSEDEPPVDTSCGASGEVTLLIPVVRQAGMLKGLFDIAGQTETAAEVSLTSLPHDVQPPLVPATSEPNANLPWVMTNIPPGLVEVEAIGLFDDGWQRLELPHRGGANGEVMIVPNETTDLGRTFVVRPRRAAGEVTLFDLSGLTSLDRLRSNIPFASLTFDSCTFIRAHGSPTIAAGGVSGFGGVADASLRGTYDASTHEARLDYELHIAGLSDAGEHPYAPRDGSTMKPAPWDVSFLRAYFGTAGQRPYGNVDMTLLEDLHLTALPPGAAGEEAIAISEQRICFGEVDLTFRVDPSLGTLYGPRAFVEDSDAAIPTAGSSFYEVRDGAFRGLPAQASEATEQVSVSLTLPAGIRHELRPWVDFAPEDGGSTSSLSLGTTFRPETGVLPCGARVGTCFDLTGTDPPQGTSLSISTQPDIPSCLETGELGVTVHVDSDGLPVEAVRYRVATAGAPAPDECGAEGDVILCSPCGADPSHAIDAIEVPAGGGVLHVFAEGANGCCASFSVPVWEASSVMPVCPSDFTALLHGDETSIPAWDPRIADRLQGSVSGGCADVALSDDRPSSFPAGETSVTFSTPGGASCATTVTVRRANAQIAFVKDVELEVRRLEDDSVAFTHDLPTPRGLVYAPDGEILGVIQADSVVTYDADDGSMGLYYPGSYVDVAFNPNDHDEVAFIRHAHTTDLRFDLIYTPGLGIVPIEIPAPFFSSAPRTPPQVAWSPDGERILVAYGASHGGRMHLHLYEYDPSQPGAPVASWDGDLGAIDHSEEGMWQGLTVLDLAVFDHPSVGRIRLVGHTWGVAIARDSGVVQEVVRRRARSVSLSPVGPVGVLVTAAPNEPGQPANRLELFHEVGIVEGPEVGLFARATLSWEDRLIAVARQDGLAIYQIDPQSEEVIVFDRMIPPEHTVLYPRFRPNPD